MRILLNQFKWDKEKLLEKYFDGNTEEFFKDAHVINPFNKAPEAIRQKVKDSYLTDDLLLIRNSFIAGHAKSVRRVRNMLLPAPARCKCGIQMQVQRPGTRDPLIYKQYSFPYQNAAY